MNLRFVLSFISKLLYFILLRVLLLTSIRKNLYPSRQLCHFASIRYCFKTSLYCIQVSRGRLLPSCTGYQWFLLKKLIFPIFSSFLLCLSVQISLHRMYPFVLNAAILFFSFMRVVLYCNLLICCTFCLLFCYETPGKENQV